MEANILPVVRLFDDNEIRIIWKEETEEFFFCVADVIVALTGTENPNNYLKQLRHRDKELSEGWLQIVTPLSVETAGGPQKMNFATLEGLFRIIQSVPSKKAEPVKKWLAAVCNSNRHYQQDMERIHNPRIQESQRPSQAEFA